MRLNIRCLAPSTTEIKGSSSKTKQSYQQCSYPGSIQPIINSVHTNNEMKIEQGA